MISGTPVSLATSVGSVNLLSLTSTRSRDSSLSMPARDDRRLERRLSVVMAGRGFRPRECRLSIIQLDRFRARRQDSVAKLSGISVNRLADKSSDCRVFARGTRLATEILVSALSARLKCLRNLHLVEGRMPMDSRLEELPRGVVDLTLEPELPDERRMFGALVRPYILVEPCLELAGRLGEALRWRVPALLVD